MWESQKRRTFEALLAEARGSGLPCGPRFRRLLWQRLEQADLATRTERLRVCRSIAEDLARRKRGARQGFGKANDGTPGVALRQVAGRANHRSSHGSSAVARRRRKGRPRDVPRQSKQYVYHPQHDTLALCIGNDAPHLCLACRVDVMVDSLEAGAWYGCR
jgi:hypothetical protein